MASGFPLIKPLFKAMVLKAGIEHTAFKRTPKVHKVIKHCQLKMS